MAGFQPNPEVIISGVVVSVQDRDFGGTPKGRSLAVMTRTGFIEVRVPLAHDAVPFAVDQHIVVACDQNFWSMPNEATGEMRHGLSITFNRGVAQAELDGIAAALSAPALSGK